MFQSLGRDSVEWDAPSPAGRSSGRRSFNPSVGILSSGTQYHRSSRLGITGFNPSVGILSSGTKLVGAPARSLHYVSIPRSGFCRVGLASSHRSCTALQSVSIPRSGFCRVGQTFAPPHSCPTPWAEVGEITRLPPTQDERRLSLLPAALHFLQAAITFLPFPVPRGRKGRGHRIYGRQPALPLHLVASMAWSQGGSSDARGDYSRSGLQGKRLRPHAGRG